MATVPGRCLSETLSKSPCAFSLYTNSLLWVVILMYLGSNSRNVSMVLYTDSRPLPFNGGSNSNEKAVFSLDAILSITLIPSSSNTCTKSNASAKVMFFVFSKQIVP